MSARDAVLAAVRRSQRAGGADAPAVAPLPDVPTFALAGPLDDRFRRAADGG